jgi:hypothetical protein
LESAAVPTMLNPWEVEVVLLPWGRELRGIWFSPDQPMHDLTKPTTQDSEEWTQARSLKPAQSLQNLRDTDSSPNPGAKGLFSDTESGWSSQAISDWASESTDDWLYPKACGANNLVYKRLLSRGFIRNVTLHSANARDIQATLSHAFSDVMEWLQFTDRDEDQMVAAHPALRASFIPLRLSCVFLLQVRCQALHIGLRSSSLLALSCVCRAVREGFTSHSERHMCNAVTRWAARGLGQNCDNCLVISQVKTNRWKATTSSARQFQRQTQRNHVGSTLLHMMPLRPVSTRPSAVINQSSCLCGLQTANGAVLSLPARFSRIDSSNSHRRPSVCSSNGQDL